MNSTSEELLHAVLALPEEDRAEIIDALIGSLPADDPLVLDDSWREVVKRRSAELRSGQVASIPWSEVKRQAREKLGG